jgi:hypothetical protein
MVFFDPGFHVLLCQPEFILSYTLGERRFEMIGVVMFQAEINKIAFQGIARIIVDVGYLPAFNLCGEIKIKTQCTSVATLAEDGEFVITAKLFSCHGSPKPTIY